MFWIIFDVLCVFVEIFMFFYVLFDLVLSIRNRKYQKKWNETKAKLIKFDPMITRAELCEQYVMFRNKYSCNVEYKDE